MKDVKFGTLNVRGLRNNVDSVIEDFEKYDLDILAIQETHLPEYEDLQNYNGISVNLVKDKGDTNHGTGIIVRKGLNPTFRRINGRICTAEINIKDEKKLLFVSAYAPHEQQSNKTPQLREDFYKHLNLACKSGKKNSLLVVAGDFNGKTGDSFSQHPNCIGKHGKGMITNQNGSALINFAEENDLFLTNTKFQHRMAHHTTWTAPFRKVTLKNGEERRNPYRNQIDYILVNNKYLRFVTESRSHGGISTDTDHKLVRMKIKLELSKIANNTLTKTEKIKTEDFAYQQKCTEYKSHLEELEKDSNIEFLPSNEGKWNKIVDICQQSGVSTLGIKEKNKTKNQKQGNDIKELSEKRKHLREKIEKHK